MLVISGGNYKADALKWRDKLFRLVRASGLSMEDQDIDLGPVFCGLYNGDATFKRWFIAKEERRRLFWLVYCLDRHLALSFNLRLSLPEGTFCVRNPLPESLWRSLDKADLNSIPPCSLGPPTRISGIGFFEYFLPLAGVLGHIIDLHHFRNHPTLGEFVSLDGIRCIETMIGQREQELAELESQAKLALGEPSAKLRLVKTYSTYLLHVFYILLHGKWDPISMIEDKDDWITSERFVTCASHALSATGVVSQILALDPEMVFMPYLFGIYLLQGSFILLLFVDRMPELGPNRSVEDVCETIIRAHEVSVVTLDTTFQVRTCRSEQRWKLLTILCRKTFEKSFGRCCMTHNKLALIRGTSIKPDVENCFLYIVGRLWHMVSPTDIEGTSMVQSSSYHIAETNTIHPPPHASTLEG